MVKTITDRLEALRRIVGDQVRDGEDDYRDPDGALGVIGEALQKVTAHHGLLSNALVHVAEHDGMYDYEPNRQHGRPTPRLLRGSDSAVEKEEDCGEAADDGYRDPGSGQQAEQRAAVESQAGDAHWPAVDVSGEQECEQEVQGKRRRPEENFRLHMEQGITRVERFTQQIHHCQDERHMSDECDKRQEGARPAWQTRTVLLRLGALRLGVWTLCGVWLGHVSTL